MSSVTMRPRKMCGQCSKFISTSNFSRHRLLHLANPQTDNHVTDEYVPVIKVHRSFFNAKNKPDLATQETQTVSATQSEAAMFNIIGGSLAEMLIRLASEWCLCCNNRANVHTCLLSCDTIDMYMETAVFTYTSDYALRQFLLSDVKLREVVLASAIKLQQIQQPVFYYMQNAP